MIALVETPEIMFFGGDDQERIAVRLAGTAAITITHIARWTGPAAALCAVDIQTQLARTGITCSSYMVPLAIIDGDGTAEG